MKNAEQMYSIGIISAQYYITFLYTIFHNTVNCICTFVHISRTTNHAKEAALLIFQQASGS
jgi:hypothetical protein